MMNLLKQIITERGLYILIAVVGFISSITTMFIDVNSQISVKWLLFLISISLSIFIIFLSLLNKVIWEKQITNKIKIIKYYPDKGSIVLKTNQDIFINSLLTIYINTDGYEELQILCYIENIQENKLLLAKIIKVYAKDVSDDLIKNGIVKTTLPFSIIGDLNE